VTSSFQRPRRYCACLVLRQQIRSFSSSSSSLSPFSFFCFLFSSSCLTSFTRHCAFLVSNQAKSTRALCSTSFPPRSAKRYSFAAKHMVTSPPRKVTRAAAAIIGKKRGKTRLRARKRLPHFSPSTPPDIFSAASSSPGTPQVSQLQSMSASPVIGGVGEKEEHTSSERELTYDVVCDAFTPIGVYWMMNRSPRRSLSVLRHGYPRRGCMRIRMPSEQTPRG
jgi:hypothetical protein